ncbi:YciI family protein [Arsenicitalea aurantiaca]|uniref:YciI family protein n=1 Tax=Arsenicitalea aurantiaca TaxID=1783274 RepID=A0A433X5I5_9HYPH|nr:YciI family protein [Arsenicitalea aurantiaca]RUT29346.1 YciI family protein [Arsenicitalea aurantiaca]
MLYAIIAQDKPNGLEDRMTVRPEHLDHLKSLGDKVVFAGATLGTDDKPTGSLMVIEAGSLEEAKAMAAADPFVTRGVFSSYEVTRWNWAVNNPTGRGL